MATGSAKSSGSSSNTSHRPIKRGIEQESEDQVMKNDDNSENENNKLIIHDTNLKVICKEENINTTVCKICFKYKTKIGEPDESETTKTISFTKKTKVEETEEKSMNLDSIKLNHNFPLSSQETGIACLVKSYDNSEKYKINDMVEFIGILSQDPSLAYMYDEHKDYLEVEQDEKITEYKMHEENKMETEDHHCKCSEMDICLTKYSTHSKKVILSEYPPSLVPRLHCIKSFNLFNNNPLLSRHFEKSGS